MKTRMTPENPYASLMARNASSSKSYSSKTKSGSCRNDGCPNSRRSASAFCQPCSDRNKKIKK